MAWIPVEAILVLSGEVMLEGDWAASVELVAANAGIALMPQSVARAFSRRDVIAGGKDAVTRNRRHRDRHCNVRTHIAERCRPDLGFRHP